MVWDVVHPCDRGYHMNYTKINDCMPFMRTKYAYPDLTGKTVTEYRAFISDSTMHVYVIRDGHIQHPLAALSPRHMHSITKLLGDHMRVYFCDPGDGRVQWLMSDLGDSLFSICEPFIVIIPGHQPMVSEPQPPHSRITSYNSYIGQQTNTIYLVEYPTRIARVVSTLWCMFLYFSAMLVERVRGIANRHV